MPEASAPSAAPPSARAPALTPERVLRRMEWRVIRRLDGRLQGDYRTVFRGAGIDVADLREYQPGDDLRHIDWNVTARTDLAHVRQYLEDREVTAWLVLDRSPSMRFGPVDRHKHIVLTEVAAVLAQLLSRGGNRVGALLFDSELRETVAPASGRNQVLRILSRLMAPPDESVGPTGPANGRRTKGTARAALETAAGATDLAAPLRAMLGLARRRGVIVVLSDFISAGDWQGPLGLLAQRHDVVPIQIADRREFELPAVGMVYVEDAETGEQIFVDTADPQFQARLRAVADERQTALTAAVRSAGTELYRVDTDEDLVRAMARVAELRRRGRR